MNFLPAYYFDLSFLDRSSSLFVLFVLFFAYYFYGLSIPCWKNPLLSLLTLFLLFTQKNTHLLPLRLLTRLLILLLLQHRNRSHHPKPSPWNRSTSLLPPTGSRKLRLRPEQIQFYVNISTIRILLTQPPLMGFCSGLMRYAKSNAPLK